MEIKKAVTRNGKLVGFRVVRGNIIIHFLDDLFHYGWNIAITNYRNRHAN